MTKPTITLGDITDLPPVLDLATAAQVLNLGLSKAYDLAKRDKFPCRVLKIGGTYRIPTVDLLRFLGINPEI